MYDILRQGDFLLICLKQDFDLPLMQTIICHVTHLEEYPHTNDIWLIEDKKANIHLGDLVTMVNEFQCHCPQDATRTKTAVVVHRGLTGELIELWVNGLKKRVSFDLGLFRTRQEAETWLRNADARVA